MTFRLPARRSLTTLTRFMATKPATAPMSGSTRSASTASGAGRTYEWLVVVPDKSLDKRLAVRAEHFAGLNKWTDAGLWKMGGAVLEEVPKDDDPSSLKFVGSTIIAVADSKDAVVKMLHEDVYGRNGVWDIEKAQIWPLKTAFRFPEGVSFKYP